MGCCETRVLMRLSISLDAENDMDHRTLNLQPEARKILDIPKP
jgi:hypothetical protein